MIFVYSIRFDVDITLSLNAMRFCNNCTLPQRHAFPRGNGIIDYYIDLKMRWHLKWDVCLAVAVMFLALFMHVVEFVCWQLKM